MGTSCEEDLDPLSAAVNDQKGLPRLMRNNYFLEPLYHNRSIHELNSMMLGKKHGDGNKATPYFME